MPTRSAERLEGKGGGRKAGSERGKRGRQDKRKKRELGSAERMRVAMSLALLALVRAQDDEHCTEWAAAGYCQSESHVEYMSLHCAETCSQTGATDERMMGRDSAYDTDADSCARWAEAGYCDDADYSVYMEVRQCMSCGAGWSARAPCTRLAGASMCSSLYPAT